MCQISWKRTCRQRTSTDEAIKRLLGMKDEITASVKAHSQLNAICRDKLSGACTVIKTKSSIRREEVLQSHAGRVVAQENLAMSLATHAAPRTDLAVEKMHRIGYRRKSVRLPLGLRAPSPCAEHPPLSSQQLRDGFPTISLSSIGSYTIALL